MDIIDKQDAIHIGLIKYRSYHLNDKWELEKDFDWLKGKNKNPIAAKDDKYFYLFLIDGEYTSVWGEDVMRELERRELRIMKDLERLKQIKEMFLIKHGPSVSSEQERIEIDYQKAYY